MTTPYLTPGLADLVPHIGAQAWVAQQLFAVQGRWSALVERPDVAVHLATASRHYGWHAQLWEQALPDSPALEAGVHVAPPNQGWLAAVDAVNDIHPAPSGPVDVVCLAALYRSLVPRAVAELVALGDMLEGPGAAHLQRVIRLVEPDIHADAARGFGLLAATLGDAEAENSAAAITATLDRAFRTC